MRLALAAACAFPACASAAPAPEPADSVAASSAANVLTEAEKRDAVRESLFPNAGGLLWLSHFTWGVDAGASVDLRGYDMSTLDVDVMIGYKNAFIRNLGIGAGLHRSFGSKNTLYPVYVQFSSSFRTKPSLFFGDIRAGYAFCTLRNGATRGGVAASLGVGVNLAMSKRFRSHILLSYSYYHINHTTRLEADLPVKYIDLARVSFGVNF